MAYRVSRGRRLAVSALVAPLALALAACSSVPTSGIATASMKPVLGGGSDAMMRDGGVVMPPPGWLDFCQRNPQDVGCLAAAFTPDHVDQLRAVQAAMWRLPRRSDEQLYHKAEYWVVAGPAGGDCEDIALAARARLLQLGWPASALRLATAWTERGEHHLVLTVDVARDGAFATLVLDSRFPTVQSWRTLERLGYRFEARQASRGATWVAIERGAAQFPAARNIRIASAEPAINAAAAFATAAGASDDR